MAQRPLFDKILIANRGEIACRVMRTCRRLGIKTVAVYSDADAQALHVRMADEAVHVGGAASADSYLRIDRIMDAIHSTGAQAVHPGYGFLSENRDFSQALSDNGIEFIGPGPHAIEAMGDKIKSMRIAQEAGVSTAPRYDGEVHTVEHALEIGKEVGYPIIMKASAGGGGKGMRVAWDESELAEGFRLAREEAASSFGDDRMLIQHYVCPTDGRHIEIQLVGDKHGNYLTLPERECSLQRRNQKVIEESPSVLLTPATRAAMQAQSAELARSVGYHSAGTVEFLCDNDENFYFLEMNTRLQVEHPVTELVTGVDLVEQMIRVAAGEELPRKLLETDWSQPSSMNGWALESRVYAEDPLRGFLPSIGRLTSYAEPDADSLPGVRVDSGIVEGSEISMYYDPMISKLCTHGKDREEATERMTDALDAYVIRGLNHNVEFLHDLYRHPRWASGALTTDMIEDEYSDGFKGVSLTEEETLHLVANAYILHLRNEMQDWSVGDATIHQGQQMELVCSVNGEEYSVSVEEPGIRISQEGGETRHLDVQDFSWSTNDYLVHSNFGDKDIIMQYGGRSTEGVNLIYAGSTFNVVVRTKPAQEFAKLMIPKVQVDRSNFLLSPMPGSLISVDVEVGDTVEAGQALCVVEAMKMQNVLRAEKAGTVKQINAAQGDTLQVDEAIMEFE